MVRQRTWIPERLKAFFGGRASYSEYLKNVAADARAIKRAKAAAELRHHAMFEAVERLPDDAKATIAAHGGDVLALRGKLAVLEAFDRPVERMKALEYAAKAPSENARQVGLAIVEMQDRAQVEIDALKPIALQAAPAPEMSLDGLFAIWVRVKAPKIERKHRATLALFKAHMGDNTDFRAVTVDDVQGFCDHLAQTGHTLTGQTKHLDNLRGLFSAAVPRYRKDNPARGVKPDGRVVKGSKLSFTGAQLRTILDRAEATAFGGKRHAEVLWALRVLVWTGARVNEVMQLRRDDVRTESGVTFIHIREGEGQSVKTGSAHKVPLHESIAGVDKDGKPYGFLAYAKASQRDFIFGAFSDDANNGRAAWLISNFRGFLDDDCGITDRKLTLHSIRHRFCDTMDNADISLERQRALQGKAGKDTLQKYGQGPGLRQLAADVAKLEPFAD